MKALYLEVAFSFAISFVPLQKNKPETLGNKLLSILLHSVIDLLLHRFNSSVHCISSLNSLLFERLP